MTEYMYRYKMDKNGNMTKIKVKRELVEKQIDEMIAENKTLFDILAKL